MAAANADELQTHHDEVLKSYRADCLIDEGHALGPQHLAPYQQPQKLQQALCMAPAAGMHGPDSMASASSYFNPLPSRVLHAPVYGTLTAQELPESPYKSEHDQHGSSRPLIAVSNPCLADMASFVICLPMKLRRMYLSTATASQGLQGIHAGHQPAG